MASPNFNFPYFSPPPHHPITPPPPPPHVPPPPTPIPPSPNNHTVIIIVFISCGGVFLLTFLAATLFCFLKKKEVQKADAVHMDEQMKIKEAIVEGPHGTSSVLLEIEDDIHIDEEIAKTQRIGNGSNLHSSEQIHHKDIEAGGETSSSHHQLEHKA
ncbi:tumor necrosis factor ligand superfamily member 6-like [Hibiscus syriacus]|uniref:tumor necrosis factor ligand superfamily member 6-like n=1 Tax=Hibiscus syriacus TaxID=106335 RepID=UPI00192406AC|nr:tumor necrosis factor ligand superfamily member 6-like [Hibiscus syriacus]